MTHERLTMRKIQEVLRLKWACGLSTLVATQVPVSEYHGRFPDPTLADAILDRLVHNAHRLNLLGESQRKVHSAVRPPSTDL